MRTVTFEPLPLDDATVALVHAWVDHPRSTFWQMGGLHPDDVRKAYAEIEECPHHEALLGRIDGEPAFLVELYDPHRSPLAGLAGLPDLAEGDRGMHVLLAPPRRRVPGHTRAVFAAVLDRCFADPGVRRVVVEPDVRNAAIARRNAEAGFRVLREIELPGKTAALSVLERDVWRRHRPRADDHLRPDVLARAQRRLVAKALAEFSHERILTPRPDGGEWCVAGADGVEYRFAARVLPGEHWAVEEESVERLHHGAATPLDVQIGRAHV